MPYAEGTGFTWSEGHANVQLIGAIFSQGAFNLKAVPTSQLADCLMMKNSQQCCHHEESTYWCIFRAV